MALLNREALLTKRELKTETVAIPEWGGEVIVRQLTAKERDDYEQAFITTKGKNVQQNMRNMRAELCVRSIVNEQGERLLQNADAAAFGQHPADVIDRIFAAAAHLSGMTKADQEELAGKSDTGPTESSPAA